MKATSFTITIPWPDPKLRSNARTHWRAKLGPKKQARERSAIECLAQRRPFDPWKTARVEVTAYHKTMNYMDCDNVIALLKHSIDGVVDAGVLADDKGLEWAPVKREKDAANPRIVLTFTEIT